MTPIDAALKIVLFLAALAGFMISFYLYHKKRSKETLVCPAGFNCDTVLHSQYSRFLGIPLELLGMLYYGLIIISYLVLYNAPYLATPINLFVITSVTVAAFLFSLYLTFIQAFNLKQWCSWCLTSAGLCTVIFFASITTARFDVMDVLIEYYDAFLLAHIIAYAIGLGVATILDIFFFKFLKDFRISEWEHDVLHTISQVLWFAFGFVVLTGIALYMPESEIQNQSPSFLAHLSIIVAQLLVLSILNLLITPRLVHISLKEKHAHTSGELHSVRKWGYALSALSFVSWYYAFFLAFVQITDVGIEMFLGVYAGIGLVAVIFSQFIDRTIGKV
ncbi:vitamin K epoxide reductase family protein [Candidatus Uhrbacteria bacterium]|nr:vitamin K epoxide reductase family protein [Candidatus Uhrbacteria bacterium]